MFGAFLRYIEVEDLESVKRLFKREYIDQRSERDKYGFYGGCTALHVASEYNNNRDIVKYLVSEGCNMEDVTNDDYGWRCIHIAAGRGKVEVLKTLIEAGCDLDSLTKRGETAPSIALKWKNKECADILKRAEDKKKGKQGLVKQKDYKSILKNNSLSKIMNPQTGKTLLDELLNYKDVKVLEAIKSKPVNDQEIDEWRKIDIRTVDKRSYKLLHECMLTRCLYQRYEDGVLDLCTTELANKKSLFMGSTALETAIERGMTMFSVRYILWKLIEEDESWTRAEEIAKKKNQPKIVSLISERREYLNEEKKSFSRLHVAVIENDPETISYILDNDIIDADEGHKKRGTALSLCYSLRHSKCADILQKNNVNIYPGLLHKIDISTIDLADGNGNTLLHVCAVSLNSSICSQLILRSANVHSINESKRTPLFELLIQNKKKIRRNMIEIVNVLINGGASVNVEDCDKYNILEVATNYDNEELLLALIHKREPIIKIKRSEWSAWLNKKHFTFMKEVIPLIDESLLKEWITEDDIKCCLEIDNVTLPKLMYDKTKSEIQRNFLSTMLQKVAIARDEKLFKELIEYKFSSNISNNKEESILNYLIKYKNEKFIVLALNSKNREILIEKEGIGKKLPLHVCIECDYWDVIDQLIIDTKSVDSEDNDGHTPLSLLLTKMSESEDIKIINRLMNYVKSLIFKSANIYKVNKLNKAVITYCTKSHLKLNIEKYFKKNEELLAPPLKETKQEQQSAEANFLVCSICEDELRNCALNCGHVFFTSCAEREVY